MPRLKRLITLCCGVGFFLAAMTVGAQGRDAANVEPSGPVKAGNQPGKNVPPGKEHATAEELYKVCLSDLQKCSNNSFALSQQVKSLQAQVAQLQKDAALPVCSNKVVWKHPKIADVDCYPYACAPNPYACHKACSSKLDCAPGRSCTADGLCAPPPKIK